MNLGILVLLLALLLFGLLAFKQINALILAPLVTIFVIVCSGMPILSSLKELLDTKLKPIKKNDLFKIIDKYLK